MEIKKAVFQGSFPDVTRLPAHQLPEFAFIGRSNVGKSSLINMLCANDKLAHTSATPGKTQLINRFLVDDRYMIVDLPGYGFARLSKKHRTSLEQMVFGYVRQAPRLTLLFVLLDCRHPLQQIDFEFLLRLGNWEVPFALILTKCDKISATAVERQKKAFATALEAYWEEVPPMIATSAQTGSGRTELIQYIGSILTSLKE